MRGRKESGSEEDARGRRERGSEKDGEEGERGSEEEEGGGEDDSEEEGREIVMKWMERNGGGEVVRWRIERKEGERQ